ncbi:MAG: hypothetical protein ACI959_001825 [Limisphaerales bacterium]|jgi:hypothetical protein
MTKFLTSLFALVLISTSITISAQTARLQVIHNSPEPIVDVYAGGALLLDNFAFRTASAFIDVAADVPVTIDIAPETSTSAADAIYSTTATFTTGETYVAIASGIVGDLITPFTLWIQDGIRETADASGVDFIAVHGSPDAPTVDIIARDVAILLDDVSYGAISAYLNVPAGAYTLDVTPGDDNYTIVGSWAADLSGLDGGAAVVFASGLLGGSPDFGLYAALADGTVVAFAPVASEITQLQVIHNAADPTVDIYLNGALIVDNFMYRTATPFVDVPADVPVLIQIAPETSTSSADAIASFSGTFRSDRDYVGIATGIIGDATTPFDIVFQGNIRQSNPFGEVQFIAYHGATDAPAVDIVADGALTLLDDVSYGTVSRYIQVPAASYTLDVNTADGLTTVVSFTADLSGLAGGNAVVFASGLLAGSPDFGLYAALADGTVIAFPIATPRLAGPSINRVFPSTVSNQLYVDLTTERENDEVIVQVVDAAGRVINSSVLNISAGSNVNAVNVENLEPGTYFVSIQSAEGIESRPFVKVD